MQIDKITNLGQLKASGYQPKSIKEELRQNLIKKLQKKTSLFEGIVGFEDTVLPDIERAILSRHNILLLGLRGQAKTKIARLLTTLLDDFVPVIAGNELNDDPMAPITKHGIATVAELGDDTPISWLSAADRYVEKLATPDVSIADLIGDVDPIKAATLKLPYSDERVIHFGLIPRSHRSIFVINELPDLQARIQVSLFNILQEGDMQIRGFKLRLPLDVQFVFTANPEDYTNRGSIITPLKDRIESQILTHYPKSIEIAKAITASEADIHADQGVVTVPELIKDLLERVVFQARESAFIDEKSGVSARMSISAMENLVSAAERRMLINGETSTTVRITDFWGIIPAITGKVELVYEGEQEGPYNVALAFIEEAIKESFAEVFPIPSDKDGERDPYAATRAWFASGKEVTLYNDASDNDYHEALEAVPGLQRILDNAKVPADQRAVSKELLLHGLVAHELISREFVEGVMRWSDPFGNFMEEF